MPHRSAAQMYRAARKSDALLTGAPLPTLFYFALPIILGNIFQQLYSIVDAIVVGKFLGDLPLAGISVAAPIVDVANALVIGGTIGIGVLCAQMCGAEDWTRLRCMNATALLGGAALTMVIAAVGIVCSVPLLRAQGTEEAVCREAAVYLQLVFAGLICCFLYNYYASMLRSCGNSRTPFVILLVSSTLHALLDVLFVGVLAWGIRGVACSTVLCQAFSAAWCILYAERRCPPLTLKRSELRFERRMGGMVLSYAWAAALQQAVVCIGRLLVQGMLTPLGTNTVTGYNMSLRIEQFLFCFSQGVSAAMVVCLSQNLGHGDRVRVRRFYRVSVCVEAALIAVLGTVCFLFPSQIVGFFSDNGIPVPLCLHGRGHSGLLPRTRAAAADDGGIAFAGGAARGAVVFPDPGVGNVRHLRGSRERLGAAGAHRGQLQRQNGAGFDYGKKRRLKIRRLGEPSYFISRSISSGSGAVKCRAACVSGWVNHSAYECSAGRAMSARSSVP